MLSFASISTKHRVYYMCIVYYVHCTVLRAHETRRGLKLLSWKHSGRHSRTIVGSWSLAALEFNYIGYVKGRLLGKWLAGL